MSASRIFDAPHYESLNVARGEVVARFLSEQVSRLGIRTAADVGCGLGHFSGLLHSHDLQVTGIDGRDGNAEEAKRRYPQISFHQCDAEDIALRQFGRFDLVFCFGLLYHLENPMATIRHLHAMTKNVLLVESVTFPGQEPIMALVDEGRTEDQGLNHLAFYPTESCLVKMLYRAGYSDVYGFRKQPNHPEYREGINARRTRTMLVGGLKPIQSALLDRLSEVSTPIAPWDPSSGAAEPDTLQKLKLLMGKSRGKK